MSKISDRIDYYRTLLLSGSELSLAVEGRFTNLRIWRSGNSIYFRLDKLNNYSSPLSISSLNYLDKPHTAVSVLCEQYGFNSAIIDDVDSILRVIKDMKQRECREW